MLGLGRFLFIASLVGLGIVVFFIIKKVFTKNKNHIAPDHTINQEVKVKVETLTVHRFAAIGLAIALFFPWVIGFSMKIYLERIGEPTYPLSSFLNPVSIIILLATTIFQWCWPFLVLSLWIGSRHSKRFAPGRSFKERLLLARTTYLGGLCAAVFVFFYVFRIWDIMYIFIPIGFFLVPPMLIGYLVGMLFIKIQRSIRTHAKPNL